MSTRTYKDAIFDLNTLQSNAATLDAAAKASGTQRSIPEMCEYLGRIGYTVSVLRWPTIIYGKYCPVSRRI